MIGFSIFLGALFVGGAIITSKMLAFHSPEGWRKVQPYECSENPIGGPGSALRLPFIFLPCFF
jgi:NADH:ubiquinone oxidoreductase subunit 3 (subunit A)